MFESLFYMAWLLSDDSRTFGNKEYFFTDMFTVLSVLIIFVIAVGVILSIIRDFKSKILKFFTTPILIFFALNFLTIFVSDRIVFGEWSVAHNNSERDMEDKQLVKQRVDAYILNSNKFNFKDKYAAGFAPSKKSDIQFLEKKNPKTVRDYESLGTAYYTGLPDLLTNKELAKKYRDDAEQIKISKLSSGDKEFLTYLLQSGNETLKTNFVSHTSINTCDEADLFYNLSSSKDIAYFSGLEIHAKDFNADQSKVLRNKADDFSKKHCISLYNSHN